MKIISSVINLKNETATNKENRNKQASKRALDGEKAA